jgi:urease beta subunit
LPEGFIMARKKTIPHAKLKPMNVGAAAIDIGSTMHMAAVNPEHSDEPIRAFGMFAIACGCDHGCHSDTA